MKTSFDLCAFVYLKLNNRLLFSSFLVANIVFMPNKRVFDLTIRTRRVCQCTKFHTAAPVGKINALKGSFVNAVAQNVSPSCQILMLLLNPPALFLRDDLSEVDSPESYTRSAAA